MAISVSYTHLIEVEGEENAIVAQILYVADGSPASEIGLKPVSYTHLFKTKAVHYLICDSLSMKVFVR